MRLKGVQPMDVLRCPWAGTDPLYRAYHDAEWGRPVHDDRKLFEFLVLEGFQAGLSWLTILRKRENFRLAFAGFDWKKVARFTPARVERLLLDPGIIRNRLKVNATISNARCFQRVIDEFDSFDRYVWQFTNGKTIIPSTRPVAMKDIPTRTPISDALSADLTNRGFKFVGSVICYSFMQAVGMVDDHLAECFRSKST